MELIDNLSLGFSVAFTLQNDSPLASSLRENR